MPAKQLKQQTTSTGLKHVVFAVVCTVAASSNAPALADKVGCEYKDIDVARYGQQPLRNPPEIVSHAGILKIDLHAKYTDPATTSIAACPVRLRSYNGQLVGPTFRARSGDVLDIQLYNDLPVQTPDQIQAQFEQESHNAHLGMFPAEFNTTNLHTHGLHVSPSGNSDNVFLMIPPQTSFPYEIKIPANHPPGTFWYHAHAHGSTSIQVGSGMEGALVLDDDPARIPAALREANKNEKILVLQTTLYDSNGELNEITALFPGDPSKCNDPGNAGTWQCAKRRVTINGQIMPVITMRPGEVQRWRIIDAGFRQSFALRLEGHSLHEIALDGLYLGHIDTWPAGKTIELQPGYRSDVLVQASQTPGTYQLISGAVPLTQAVRAFAQPGDVIALVRIEGEPANMVLPTNAEMAAMAPFPGVDLRQSATGVQEAVFKLGSDVDPNNPRLYFQVNYQPFDDSRVRKVVLNTTERWSLTTVGNPPEIGNFSPAPHVFHIHVNPFQVARKDPAGADELVWKDTILVPTGTDPVTNKRISQRVDVYTRYTDYIGKFVLHCHILDHEDLGMMEVVEVIEPEPTQMRMRMEMKNQ
jgi:FtsP/CotA-like multicopper oxidase with cupredoxin domain